MFSGVFGSKGQFLQNESGVQNGLVYAKMDQFIQNESVLTNGSVFTKRVCKFLQNVSVFIKRVNFNIRDNYFKNGF